MITFYFDIVSPFGYMAYYVMRVSGPDASALFLIDVSGNDACLIVFLPPVQAHYSVEKDRAILAWQDLLRGWLPSLSMRSMDPLQLDLLPEQSNHSSVKEIPPTHHGAENRGELQDP